MVKKILKVTGIVLGIIVVLAAGFFLKAYISVESRRSTHYNVVTQPITINHDSATLALGARLVKAKGCTECHGNDLGGKVFIDDAPLAHLISPNLTKGKGGLAQDHNVEDWILALKHGIR